LSWVDAFTIKYFTRISQVLSIAKNYSTTTLFAGCQKKLLLNHYSILH
jgi:hypothetical protein